MGRHWSIKSYITNTLDTRGQPYYISYMNTPDKDLHTCYTCNTPVLPNGEVYQYTIVYWNREYIFCSKGCQSIWENPDEYIK